MKVLIIGSGGREHAIAWKVLQSPKVTQVYVAPGNAGTALEAGVKNVDISVNDSEALAKFAAKNKIDLTIVGPEAPLTAGIVDYFESQSLPCFGPSQACARLEGSKIYSKNFMQQYQIPTAKFAHFYDYEQAVAYLQQQTFPQVIKADGLAAGKGVIIADNLQQGLDALEQCMQTKSFGNAGSKVVIEEFIQGVEASFIVIADGNNYVPFATSQDHKARDEGDQGPNTGGMGAYSPAPVITESLHQKICQTVIEPALQGMAEQGTPYVGFLYAGLMITPSNEIKVLEFNCRLGDPETQVILSRLQSDLLQTCMAALQGELSTLTLQWDPNPAIGIVLASGGYPNDYKKGYIIEGLETQDNQSKVFHAGTKLSQDNVVTNGGRVLCITSNGSSLQYAKDKALEIINNIHWQDMFYRKDIGYRALKKASL